MCSGRGRAIWENASWKRATRYPKGESGVYASQSVGHLERMSSSDVRFLKRYGIIRSHIGSTQECEMVLNLERFSHQSGQSFGLTFPIGLEALLGEAYLLLLGDKIIGALLNHVNLCEFTLLFRFSL